jgi:hypothetical protein
MENLIISIFLSISLLTPISNGGSLSVVRESVMMMTLSISPYKGLRFNCLFKIKSKFVKIS